MLYSERLYFGFTFCQKIVKIPKNLSIIRVSVMIILELAEKQLDELSDEMLSNTGSLARKNI